MSKDAPGDELIEAGSAAATEALSRQQENLWRIVEVMSSELDLSSLLAQIIRYACELLGAEIGTLGLVDETRGLIRIEATYGITAPELGPEVPPGMGLMGQIFLDHQPLVLKRYGDLMQPVRPALADYAVIGMPIYWRGPMIGVLGVGAAPPREFSQADVDLLSLFVRHAAIAIHNARLFEAERRRANQVAVISYVGRLISTSLNLDQLLQTTVEAISQHLHYPNIAILLVDPADSELLVLRARSGIYAAPEVNHYRQRIDQGIIGAAARTRQRLLIQDVRRDSRYLPLPYTYNVCAELAVPLVRGDRLLGVLNIESERPISQDDAEGFATIADQLGVAIDNARLFTETQRALDQARLLYETSQRIGTAMGVDEVIRAYLEQVAVRGRYACQVVLYDFNEAGERMGTLVRGRWTPEEGLMLYLREPLPDSYEVFTPFLDAGQAVALPNVQADARMPESLRRFQMQAGRSALALIPLMVRGHRTGLVILSYPHVHPWPEVDLQLYQATAVQLAIAIDHRQQYHLLYERGQQVAVLQERQRLARELHDSVTQLIFSMTLIAQSIGPAWRRDPTEAERRIDRLLELSQSALTEMRALLAELRPPELSLFVSPLVVKQAGSTPLNGGPVAAPGIVRLQHEGLVAVLRQHIADVSRDGLEIEFDPAGYIGQSQEQEEALYRITQEALNNVVKHAQARRVSVQLSTDSLNTRLTVSDDGLGFSPEYLESATPPRVSQPVAAMADDIRDKGSFGLMSMRERATALGGTIRLSTIPGQGTTVAVSIPRKDKRI